VAAYSFKDCKASIAGPAGNMQIGMGAGTADEGITFERAEDRNAILTGSDGSVMHSLHAADHGTVRVRLLKTSTTNGKLMDMYKSQRRSSSFWGQNVITLQDTVRGDKVKATDVAFTGEPALTYGKAGNVNEWTFAAGHIEGDLDQGVPPPIV
jgi:hypothetical protein